MENKELKKPIPVELNEEELDMVAGGENTDSTIRNLAVNNYFNECIPCRHCGKLVLPTEVVYSNRIYAYCRDCYEKYAK